MAGPATIFNADECQALLDLLDRLMSRRDDFTLTCGNCGMEREISRWPFGLEGKMLWNLLTSEEKEAYEKLKKAGAFYISKSTI